MSRLLTWPIWAALVCIALGPCGCVRAGFDGDGADVGVDMSADMPLDVKEQDAGGDALEAGIDASADLPIGSDQGQPPTTLCEDGWCWDDPLPHGQEMFGAFAVGQTVFVAGGSGQVMRRDPDGSWHQHTPRAATTAIGAIWGDGPNNIFVAVGGFLRHWNGIDWTLIDTQPIPIRSLHGLGGIVLGVTDVRPVVYESGAVMDLAPTAGGRAGIMLDATSALVVSDTGAIARHNVLNGTVSSESSGVATPLLTIATDGTTVLAGGENGTLIRRSGANWVPEPSATNLTINHITFAGSQAYALTQSAILTRMGVAWSATPTGFGSPSRGAGLSDGTLFVGEPDGVSHFFDGTTLSSTAKPPIGAAIWGTSAENLIMVGGGGMIRERTSNGWTTTSAGISENLFSVWSDGNVYYVVGANGAVFRRDGPSPSLPWTNISADVAAGSVNLNSVHGSSANDVVIVGSSGTIVRLDTGAWIKQPQDPSWTFRSVWSLGPNLAYAGHDDGLIRYTGSTWIDAGQTMTLVQGVWASSASDVYAVTPSAVHYFDGATWTQDFGGTLMTGVFGSGPNDVWISQLLSGLRHKTGGTWSTVGIAAEYRGGWATAGRAYGLVFSGGVVRSTP